MVITIHTVIDNKMFILIYVDMCIFFIHIIAFKTIVNKMRCYYKQNRFDYIQH